jgi:hypothetical protein
MSLTVSQELLEATKSDTFGKHREHSVRYGRRDEEVELTVSLLTNDDLVELARAAEEVKDGKTRRAIEAMLAARAGKHDLKVPNFKAFEGMLNSFLRHNVVDGWLYVRDSDGSLYPELITSVRYESKSGYRSKENPYVYIHTVAYTLNHSGHGDPKLATTKRSHCFEPSAVVNKRVADILEARGIFKETPELKAEYEASMKRHEGLTRQGFAKQFRVNGACAFFEDDNHRREGEKLVARRVIHDNAPNEQAAHKSFDETSMFEDGVGTIPEHPLVRCFDIKSHEFYWVRGDFLTPHEYDKSVGEKLILPDSHRDLLEVLTTDLDIFTSDFIEGKAAGNVVLCKGLPGVGKTATAECYAEITEVPLYSINTGTLGTNAADIHRNLQVIFQRAKRWGCALLLDEADVFVMRRGNDVEQNAIVAEFLRVLEYFDGLLWLTTNRPDDIDDAIVSRTVAIIEFKVPEKRLAGQIWRVMAKNFETKLEDSLIEQLLELFPGIAPRDIKMLLRLVLKVARKREQPLTIDLFRRTAMFRAVSMAELRPAAA